MAKKAVDPGKGAKAATDTLSFVFTLPDGTKSPIVIVAGGADVNGDGKISQKDEVTAFESKGNNVWTRDQPVAGTTKDMLFAVTFTIGSGVKWTLKVTNGDEEELYSGKNTTKFDTDTVSYHFER